MAFCEPINTSLSFLQNDHFKYFVTDKPWEYFYDYPTMYYRSDSKPLNLEMWQPHFDAFIAHEMCHLFRNFLIQDYNKMFIKDHDLTYKNYVTREDMLTEIQTVTLEELILEWSGSELFKGGDLQKAMFDLNSKFAPMPMARDEVESLLYSTKQKWYYYGKEMIREQFQQMIQYCQRVDRL